MARCDAEITTVKVADPIARTRFYVRHRLGVRPAQGGRLLLLLAPAGFGKSALMKQWHEQCLTAGRATAWLSLDHTDDNPTRLAACIRTVCRELGGRTSGDALVCEASVQCAPESTVEELIDALSLDRRAGVIFLDNLDRLTSPAAQRTLFDFVRRLPPHIHCIVASRRMPSWPLAKLRIAGDAAIVTAESLRFTLEESAEFLRELHGLDLAPVDLARLHDSAEGWPVVLTLAGAGLASGATITPAAALKSSQALLFEYLDEEILGTLNDEARDLLIRTAPFARLCAALCNSITGRADGQALLRQLEREHMVLVPLDSDGQWFRPRACFAEFLQQHFEQMDLPTRCSIHLQASLWYERNEQREEAVSHALAAQDYDRAARLLDALALDTIYSSRMNELLDWVRRVPTQTARSHPSVLVCAMWALFLTGRLDEIGRHLPGGQRMLESILETDDSDQDSQRRGWRDQLRLLAEIRKQRESESRFNAETLLDLRNAQSPDNHLLLGLIDITLARRYLQRGDMDEARACFVKAQFHSDRAGNVHAAVQASCGLAHIHHVQGRLSQGLAVSEESVRYISTLARGPAPVAAVPHLRMAEIFFERNVLDSAKDHLRQCMTFAETLGDPACARRVELLSVRIAYAERGAGAALERLQEIEQLAIKSHHEEALRRIYAAHAALLCEVGDLAGADALLQILAVPRSPPAGAARKKIPHWDEDTYLALVRFHIANAKPAAAIQWLTTMQRSAHFAERRLSLVKIEGLLAIGHESHGQHKEARRALRRMLLIGEECGFMRSIVDLDPAMRPMIRSFLQHQSNQPDASNLRPSSDYLNQLLQLSEVRSEARHAAPNEKLASTTEAPLPRPLTPRESEILHLLAEGLSNHAIAEHLAIAETTLKWHIQNMYGTLHVRSRTQAVARARRLALIS